MKTPMIATILVFVVLLTGCHGHANRVTSGIDPASLPDLTTINCSDPDYTPEENVRWTTTRRLDPDSAHLRRNTRLFFSWVDNDGKEILASTNRGSWWPVRLFCQRNLNLPGACEGHGRQRATHYQGFGNIHGGRDRWDDPHVIDFYFYESEGRMNACIQTSHFSGDDLHDGAAHTHQE